MCVARKQRLLKYWLKIITKKPYIVYDVYKLLVTDSNNGKDNWATNIRNLLFQLGFNYLWFTQDNINITFDILNERLLDQFYQSWRSSVQESEKLCVYKLIKTEFSMENYLLNDFNVRMMSLLRFGTLKLNVEIGRYINQPRSDRLCKCCSMDCIENEYHFVMVCPAYRQFRLKYFSRHYCSWPNMNKFCSLLTSKSKKVIYNIMSFLRDSWNLRAHIIS